MRMSLGMDLSLTGQAGPSGNAAPSFALKDGPFTAATSRTTASIPNGSYDVLLKGGAGGNRWQSVIVTTGFITITDAATFTELRYFGPHTITPKATGVYGPNLRYYGLFSSVGQWEGGSSYSAPAALVGDLGAVTTGANITPVHQAWCGGDASYYYTIDNSTGDGLRKRSRVDWSVVDTNASPTGHQGAGKYYGGTITNGGNSYTGTLLIPTENYAVGNSNTFRIRVMDVNTAGLPEVKTLVVPLTAGAGGDEMSGLCVDDSGNVFISDHEQSPPKVHRTTIASINATADGGTITMLPSWTYSNIFRLCQGIAYKNGRLYLCCQMASPLTNNVVVVLDSTTGAEIGFFELTGASAGAREGVDFDIANGKIGVLYDNSGSGSVLVNFWTLPSDPSKTAAGYNLNSTHGLSFPGVKLDGLYSTFAIELPTSNALVNGAKQGRFGQTQSGNTFYEQIETSGRVEYRVVSTAGSQAQTTMTVTANGSTRWAHGCNYDNAATPAQTFYSYSGNTTTASGVSNWATGSTSQQTFPSVSRAGISPNFTSGRPATTLGLAMVFSTRNFTQVEFDALRNDPTVAFDVTDGLTSPQMTAAAAAA